MFPFYASTCSLCQFDEIIIILKSQNLEISKQRTTRENYGSFIKSFG